MRYFVIVSLLLTYTMLHDDVTLSTLDAESASGGNRSQRLLISIHYFVYSTLNYPFTEVCAVHSIGFIALFDSL